MPIRPEFLHFYQTPEWEQTRARILERAGYCCENCGAENGAWVMRLVLISEEQSRIRRVQIQLGVAHLDHNPANMSDSNLRALCRGCHLAYDAPKHKETRSIRKDAARPLLAANREGM